MNLNPSKHAPNSIQETWILNPSWKVLGFSNILEVTVELWKHNSLASETSLQSLITSTATTATTKRVDPVSQSPKPTMKVKQNQQCNPIHALQFEEVQHYITNSTVLAHGPSFWNPIPDSIGTNFSPSQFHKLNHQFITFSLFLPPLLQQSTRI